MKTRIALSVGASVAALIVVGLCSTRSRVVLFEFSEPGDPLGPIFTVFHPLRDRGPEKAAESLLKQIRSGNSAEALSRTALSAERQGYVRQHEEAHPILRWSLVERKDTLGGVTLVYACTRRGAPDSLSHLTVKVASNRDPEVTEWMIEAFDAWY